VQAEVRPEVAVGDVILFDDRIFHKGTANNSDTQRAVIFLSCSTAWFTDNIAGAQATTAWAEIE
jgi:ectoine hydroxylase-related dioxygenase (phytanoyl-CoA dioxygenase family)